MGVAHLGHRESHPCTRCPGRLAGAEMIPRVLRKLFSADAMGLILVVTALQVLTYGISSSLQNTDTRYFFWICLVAALISFGLSRTKLNGIPAAAGMAALGILGGGILGARLASPLLDLGEARLSVAPHI